MPKYSFENNFFFSWGGQHTTQPIVLAVTQCTIGCHFAKIGLIRVKNGCSRVKFVAILLPLQKCNSFFGSYKHKGDN